MSRKLWVLQTGIVLIYVSLLAILKLGLDDRLSNSFLRKSVYPVSLSISNFFLDAKFLLRGKISPKEPKIVILDIDNNSVQAIGRWPWHRDVTAELIDKTFKAGARVVGLDMVFSEPDVRVSDELQLKLESLKLGYLKSQVETDPLLARTIDQYADRLVLGWTPQGFCQPLLSSKDECPLIESHEEIEYPDNFNKFSVQNQIPELPAPHESYLISSYDTLSNLSIFNQVAQHSGFFQAFPDSDGVIRRAPLVQMVNGRAFPSLALEMARIVLEDELQVQLGAEKRLQSLSFMKNGQLLETTSTAFVDLNSRGPGYTFPYITALDVFSIGEKLEGDQLKASQKASELLKGAYVFIGLSALGAADLRAFTFDKVVPGVEGHATILDNILANDFINRNQGWSLVFALALAGFVFSWLLQKLGSTQGLIFLVGALIPLGVLDHFVFLKFQDWHLAFFGLEVIGLYGLTAVVKYINEEKDKQFLKKAFSRYVSAELVDSMLKDPSKLSLGGERKNLTILFSDIRSFTTFSEKMDAKQLSLFLNDYFGLMTEIIFTQKGTLDKFIGDAIMAFWGAPVDLSNHASSACEAAIQMVRQIGSNHQKYQQLYDIDLQVGIGINTGTVSVGNLGSNNNFSYTVIGDQVNLASRVEGLTKYYGVNILTTRFTLDAIIAEGRDLPKHRSLDFVRVKGKLTSVELIHLIETEISVQALSVFGQARQAYLEQRWDQAIELFDHCDSLVAAETGKADVPCQIFKKRCQAYLDKPPIQPWDGSWDMLEK